MARGPQYKVPFRRRREYLTDYRRRLKLVISGKPRLVVRKTNRYVIAQVIKAKIKGDETIVSAHTSELRKLGWKYSLKNVPACYLLGLIIGYRAAKLGLNEAILDIGLQRPTKGSRVFAVVKGAIDAGLNIPVSKEKLPDENRILGNHIKEFMEKVFAEVGGENIQFSRYLKMRVNPSDIVEDFKKVKRKIVMEIGGEGWRKRER
ncbi:MAG: 50S ribosomal protein L18 [Candidatus Methanomethylicia archaeon]